MASPRDLDQVFAGLARSTFRQRFRLGAREQAYLRDRGLTAVLDHARDFIARRLAPADPANDGKQTPMRGHPVFIAQHATATCCRSCLEKWHGIPRGRALDEHERTHAVAAIGRWLREHSPEGHSPLSLLHQGPRAVDPHAAEPHSAEEPMPAETAWFAKHLTARAHGCDLAVSWRPDGRWIWTVTVAGERIADGMARSQEAAQDAAVRAARDHARRDGSIQLDMF